MTQYSENYPADREEGSVIILVIFRKDKEELKAPSKYKNKIDVCIFSNEKNKEKGIRLLSMFWKQGIKALADFRNKKPRG